MPSSYRSPTLFIGTILIGILFVRPQYTAVQAFRASIRDHQAFLQNINTYNATLQKQLADINALTASDALTLGMLTGSDGIEPAKVLVDLEGLATRFGLSVQNVTLHERVQPRLAQAQQNQAQTTERTAVNATDFYTQDFDLRLAGTYPQLKQFVEALEKSTTPYKPVLIKFNTEGEGSIISFEMRVRTYALVPRDQF